MHPAIRRKSSGNVSRLEPGVPSLVARAVRDSRCDDRAPADVFPPAESADPLDLAFFAGRTAEKRRLSEWFRNRPECPYMAVSGFYRSGKSSLGAWFVREHRDRIFPLRVDFSLLPTIMAASDPFRDIRRRIRERIVLGGDGERFPDEAERASSESIRDALSRRIRHAARREKRVLLIFDDVDVLDESPSAPLLADFLEWVGELGDAFRSDGDAAPKFLVLGQYRLYRHLTRTRRDGRWRHLVLDRRIARDDCLAFANRRLASHRTRFPFVPQPPDFGERVAGRVGRAPQDLAGFLDFFFRDPRFPEPGNVSGRESFLRERIEDFYYRILVDPAVHTEFFERLETEYLRSEENRIVARVLESLARSPETGLPEETLLNAAESPRDLRRRIMELTDFGFVDRRRVGGRWWLYLYKSLVSDFIRNSFAQPLLKRSRRL